jgi:thiol-disulfide isomerase/thioredoxin
VTRKNLAVASAAIVVAIIVGAIVWHFAAPSRRLAAASQPPPLGQATVGQRAPEFILPTTGGLFDMDKAHKPAFVEIFATWCPHCQRETAVIDRLYEAYKSRASFVGVSGSNLGMDEATPASQADVLAWTQRFHAAYPVAYDPSLTVANSYLQGGFPTFAIVGRDGNVTYVNSGELSYQDLAAALDAALGGK